MKEFLELADKRLFREDVVTLIGACFGTHPVEQDVPPCGIRGWRVQNSPMACWAFSELFGRYPPMNVETMEWSEWAAILRKLADTLDPDGSK